MPYRSFIYNNKILKIKKMFLSYWGLGDWGLGIGDWGLGPIPNPQSPYFSLLSLYTSTQYIYVNNLLLRKKFIKKFDMLNFLIFLIKALDATAGPVVIHLVHTFKKVEIPKKSPQGLFHQNKVLFWDDPTSLRAKLLFLF